MTTSDEHEIVVDMANHCPSILLTVASILGIQLPTGTVQPYPGSASVKTVVLRMDNVLVLKDESDRVVRAFVIEPQRDIDDDKIWSWPQYIGKARADLRCQDVELIAITPSVRVAEWARQPLRFAGTEIRMRVIGPDNVPPIPESAEDALKDPQVAALSIAVRMLSKGRDPEDPDLARRSIDQLIGAQAALGALNLPNPGLTSKYS